MDSTLVWSNTFKGNAYIFIPGPSVNNVCFQKVHSYAQSWYRTLVYQTSHNASAQADDIERDGTGRHYCASCNNVKYEQTNKQTEANSLRTIAVSAIMH